MSPNQKLIIFFTENNSLSDMVKVYLDSVDMGRSLSITDSIDDMERVISSGKVVLSLVDQSLGKNNVNSAIEIQKKLNTDLPIVIITNKNMQDDAAEMIEKGAYDYITTDNLKRLGPVIRREIKTYNELMAGKKARQEIKELMNIIESAEDEIYILGGDSYRVKFANRKALKNLGYSMEELYGTHMQDIAEELLPVDIHGKGELQGRASFRTRFRRKDGSEYIADAVFQTAETEGKIAVLCIVHDVTETEQARKHAYVLDKAIDASASAVTVVDENFKVIYTNRTQCQVAGRQLSPGTDITEEVMYAHSGKEFFDALFRCRSGENWVGEYQKSRGDGDECIVLGSMSPVLDDDNRISNIVIVEEDITERVRIKSQLLHAQKMETVGELTSGIAHDFTNMLTAIGGFSSIMKRKMDRENRFYPYVEKISELTVRAKSLTKNLLTFSRKQVQAERVISINTLVKSVGEFLSMVIGSRIELKLRLMEDDIYIMGDPVQLEQVIINLATNARDAIEVDGELTIITDQTMLSDETVPGGFRKYAVLRVQDNGCGIEPAKAEKIFEPFFTTKQEGKGTGLGLYIVSDIIERHGGQIECSSEPGEGTEFIIKLPTTDQKPEIKSEEQENESDDVHGLKILIVEDEKIVRESLVHALDVYGYDILEAVNGKEALQVFKDNKDDIDVVITDIVMPVMNGITAYNEIIKIKPEQKFIFTTGYVGEAHRKDGFIEEEHVVMIKPLMIKDLIKNIETILAE